MSELLEELRWRGLVHQVTHDKALEAALSKGSCRVYSGFDPTADALTIGNLVPLMLLLHFQRAGHQPFVLLGGGTGLIGDPSGKSAERQLLTAETVAHNVAQIGQAIRGLLATDDGNGSGNGARFVDNKDWLGALSYITVLRDVGKHFAVNMMIQKDSVRERLHNREQGISYTEFSYMILQAYDFLHLAREHQVVLQIGGSDQWGNIVAGTDLVRRVEQREVFGLTAPLITKADGSKFGKTESGAIWLSKDRTSPYAYYQFWLNASDQDVAPFLKIYTLLSRAEIETLLETHAQNPQERLAQRTLAREATLLLHGTAALEQAEAATRALFSGAVGELDRKTLEEAFGEAPSSEHSLTLLAESGLPLVDLLATTTLAKSKREAREHLSNGAVTLNGEKVDAETRVTRASLLHGDLLLLRRGKKAWHVTRWR
jgi:tyrosyl-tRNA synthetase